MKCHFNLIWILIILLLNTSCHNEGNHKNLIEIDFEHSIRNVKPINICDCKAELQYIPLKGNSVMLRTAALVDFHDDFILVSDRRSCCLFDNQGNLQVVFGNKGKGPGEFVNISNFKFGLENEIIIQDINYFLVYSMTGKFLRRIKPEANPEKLGSGGILYGWTRFNDSLFIGQVPNDSGKERAKAVFFNGLGTTVKSIDNSIFLNLKQKYNSSLNSDASIYSLQGNFYFKEIFNDTVFLVTNQLDFKPFYYIDLGKYGLPKAVRELPINEMNIEVNKYILIYSIYETSRYIFLNCNFNDFTPVKRSAPLIVTDVLGNKREWWYYNKAILGIYDKLSKDLSFAQPEKEDDMLINSGLRNDYDGGINFYPKFYVNDSTLAMRVDAYELKQHVSSLKFKNSIPKYPEKKEELHKLANSLSDNDNPVLILCTFKK